MDKINNFFQSYVYIMLITRFIYRGSIIFLYKKLCCLYRHHFGFKPVEAVGN